METEIGKPDPPTAKKFITDLTTKVLDTSATILTRYDLVTARHGLRLGERLTKEDSAPELMVKAKLMKNKFPETDAEHLAGATGFGQRGKVNALFVSLDYKDIVYRREEILRVGGPLCCDPLYASLHALHQFS